MSGFFDSFKQGMQEATDPLNAGRFQAGGKEIVCPHCGNKQFDTGKAQLNTAVATLFELDWLNKSANILICKNCSHILWFGKSPEVI